MKKVVIIGQRREIACNGMVKISKIRLLDFLKIKPCF